MDTLIRNLIEGLKSTSSSVVQETLIEIKSKVIANDNGIKLFTECKGLNCLVPHLRKPNERILDITLSILGNCCLDEDCRSALRNLNIVPSLVTVLKTVCRDSIVGRACRVIGNLALNTSSAEDLHNHGAVPALVALIENRDKHTSYPTLAMAVRATRQLWTVTSKREEMLSVNSVLCISILLTAECESAGLLRPDYQQNKSSDMKKSQEELISGILKSFVYFTTQVIMQCAEQINGDGRGYQCLVALSRHTTFGSPALRCLMNLCFLSNCRPLLGNAGLVPCLVSILEKIPEACWWPEGAARMLSQLSGESVNRARIREFGGMSLLIVAAKEHTFALRALLQYIFDDLSFQMLVKEGLIGLVVDELKKHLATMKYEHDYKNPDDTQNESNHDAIQNNVEIKKEISRFKRRLPTRAISNEDELNVVIERDNMFVGFGETINSDASDSQNEDEAPKRKRVRARSTSPSSFLKRSREWRNGMYWEMKPSTSRSPEPAPMSPGSDGALSFSPEYRSAAKRSRGDWSPESGFSTGEGSSASPYWTEYQWSPASSVVSPVSMLSSHDDSSDSETSGRYSPVCSDSDAGVVEVNKTTIKQLARMRKTLDVIQLTLDDLAMNDSDMNDSDTTPDGEDPSEETDNINSSRIACVLVLLSRLSNGSYECEGEQRLHKKESVTQSNLVDLLAGKECLNALLDYVERCRTPRGRAERILNLIFGNSFCLINILKHKIVLRLHNMTLTSKHPLNECKQCRLLKKLCAKLILRLSTKAEASHGVGEISFQLLRGPNSMKETLSLTLPYIVKSKPILKKYFIDCRALMILFAAIPETTEEFEYFVTALGKLATNVKIVNPKTLDSVFEDEVRASYNPLEILNTDEIVVFKLDDLSTVTANKTFLCRNSDVFEAMLEGCFKERTEKVVNIKNATKPGLEYLLTLLHRGLDSVSIENVSQVKVIPVAEKLEANLEALLLADRFLFHRLKNLLRSAILQFKLKPDTADKIYVWSLNEGMGFLCVEAVAYLLTGNMRESDRARAFKNIMSLKYKEQWLDDVKTIILRHLDKWK